MSKVNFEDILYDVKRVCTKLFYYISRPDSSDLLQTATQIYIEERKLEESRKEKEEKSRSK